MAGDSLSGREGRVGVVRDGDVVVSRLGVLALEVVDLEALALEVLALEVFALEDVAREDFALEDRSLEVFAREVFAREVFARDVFVLVAFFAGDAFLADARPDFFDPLFIDLRACDLPFFLAAMATLLPVIRKAACSRVAAASPRSINPYSL